VASATVLLDLAIALHVQSTGEALLKTAKSQKKLSIQVAIAIGNNPVSVQNLVNA